MDADGGWTMSTAVQDGLTEIFSSIPSLLAQACAGALTSSADSQQDVPPGAPPLRDPESFEGLPSDGADSSNADPLTACSWTTEMQTYILGFP